MPSKYKRRRVTLYRAKAARKRRCAAYKAVKKQAATKQRLTEPAGGVAENLEDNGVISGGVAKSSSPAKIAATSQGKTNCHSAAK